ncbi:MAG: M13 family metallopeptidase [Thermomicrobiales bacterium]
MRQTSRWLALLLAALITLSPVSSAVAAGATPVASPAAAVGHGIQTADMDLSADPAKDFYRYANGGWLDRTTIPSDRPSYGVFDELGDRTTETQLAILASLTGDPSLVKGSDEWKAVPVFGQGRDQAARDALGLTPVQPLLKQIDALTDTASVNAYEATSSLEGASGFFSVYAYADLADSSMTAAYLTSGPLRLPNRDYYLKDDAATVAVRDAYTAANARFLRLVGYDEPSAAAQAKAVTKLEHALAAPTLTREEQQDFSKSYNPMKLADLAKEYPGMDWPGYLKMLGIGGADTLVVTEPGYFKALAEIVKATPIETVKAEFKVQVLWAIAPYLDRETYKIYFDFQGKTLNGQETSSPLERRVLGQVNGILGQAVGKLYVAQAFPPDAKSQIVDLVHQVTAAYRARLADSAWLSPEAKRIALDKLDKVAIKVGYPDAWRSYDAVAVGGSYVKSMLSGLRAEAKRQYATVGKPVDRTEWGLNPQDVNAYYNPSNNEIVFPAAILQPPFFDYKADPASNFGAIGSVIGHEITHGFDINGSQFDAQGNFGEWWTAGDKTTFEALQKRLVDQYGAIEVLPGLKLDGQIEIGENTADLGGIQNAYSALQGALKATGDPGKIDGLTQDQRFFIAASQAWREVVRNEALTTQVKTDVHAPGSVRGVQPMRNADAFYAAFPIKPGDPMFLPPERRVVIW